jgi:hypothetical protein
MLYFAPDGATKSQAVVKASVKSRGESLGEAKAASSTGRQAAAEIPD